MKLSLIALSLISFNSFAGPDAIYGDDNRLDVFQVTNPLYVKLAHSTAAMINKDKIKTGATQSVITGSSLGEMYHLCPDQRFKEQPVAATCSGTLIAPDIIMTAAHCYEMVKSDCKNHVWVFDYKVSQAKQSSVTVDNNSIYECEKVILKEEVFATGIDQALIKLKRVVNDRDPLPLRQTGDLKENDELVLIGHPSGLPTKVAADGHVLKVENDVLKTNVDAFSVNSGSGVFNAVTGEVEGILVSGQMDYDGKGNCTSTKTYLMNEGNESVVKVKYIKNFLDNFKSN